MTRRPTRAAARRSRASARLTVDATVSRWPETSIGILTVELIAEDGEAIEFALTSSHRVHQVSVAPGRYALAARRPNGSTLRKIVKVDGDTTVRLDDQLGSSPQEFMHGETARGEVAKTLAPTPALPPRSMFGLAETAPEYAPIVATAAAPVPRRLTIRMWTSDEPVGGPPAYELGTNFLKISGGPACRAIGLVDNAGFGPIVIVPPFHGRSGRDAVHVTFLAKAVASRSAARYGNPLGQRSPVALISLDDPVLGDFLSAIASPLVEHTEAIWQQSAGTTGRVDAALMRLSDKFRRPAEAVLAAHYLLRFLPDRLPLQWCDNLVEAASGAADGPVIAAWLRLEGRGKDVRRLRPSASARQVHRLIDTALEREVWFARGRLLLARGLALRAEAGAINKRLETFINYGAHAGGLEAFWGTGPAAPGPGPSTPTGHVDVGTVALVGDAFADAAELKRIPPRRLQTMAEDPSSAVALVAQQRIIANREEIKRTMTNVAAGNPLASEKSPVRLIDRLMAKNLMTREEAEATAIGIRAFSGMSAAERTAVLSEGTDAPGAEAIWGQTIDFTGVSFFQRGRSAANAVARVAWLTGRPRGSGFMVSDRLFLTNNHVIPTPELAAQLRVEFDYELDIHESPIAASTFAFAPQIFFVTDDVRGLDFTLIAVGERLSGARELAAFGYCPLSDASDKHAIGEVVNVVQHPNGRYKEVVLRENRLVARAPQALHYVADTLPGSSGSPVFNNQWQAVALHHWGGPFRDLIDDAGQRVPREVNEGIRISSIVQAIKARRGKLPSTLSSLIDGALSQWELAQARTEAAPPDRQAAATAAGPRTNTDGSISWTIPIEITVRPLLAGSAPQVAPSPPPQQVVASTPAAAEKLVPSDDYSDRGGYEPGFIGEHVVPLPKLSSAQRADAARNKDARAGDNPYEFQYHHFSVLVNAKRRLAYVAACNIDGAKSKFVDRDTGQVAALDPSDPKHGLSESLEGAEASEEWFDDGRLRPTDAVAGTETYETQKVPGFPTSSKMQRTLRMFQRGHLVRRLDPAWGTANEARLAEADTFHFTNCAPQVGFFNMGKGRPNQRGTGGGKLWRAVENLVLRNARTMRTRVCAFTGPIFADDDREFRTIQVPGRFFKIAVWADEEGLRSLGMIADQRPVFGPWPEALFDAEQVDPVNFPEAFQDEDELERVDDFLTTIAEISRLTGLDFGEAVEQADIRRGEPELRPERLDDISLKPAPPKGGSPPPPRRGARKVNVRRRS